MRNLAATIAGVLLTGFAYAGSGGSLNPGDKFPEWTMVDSTWATVSSRDLAGKVYLLWYYPKAMTSGCTAEGCALRDNYAEFTKLKVEVLGVSYDPPEKNAEFIRENRFPFRLLTDQDRALAIAVGAADSDKRLWARRISYLVGPDGRVLRAYPDVDPKTHAAQVLADLASLTPTK
jgi:thioredoxin-dependent peroxiredoxin